MPYNRAWGDFIPDKTVNQAIATWQDAQPERVRTYVSPSTLLECPRVVWLRRYGVPATNPIGWGKKQRFALGRITEDYIATQLEANGTLLYHWPDNYEGQSAPLAHGEGLDYIAGTPDFLLQLHKVAISDSKTSRSDSFRYVPVESKEIWLDPYWYKYKLQLVAYFMLCHWNKDWFTAQKLPLPEICHLFSYALDDGIVRREITWTPSKLDATEVQKLIRRWNRAYVSPDLPDCTCITDGQMKFCRYGIAKKGDKVCSSCCDASLVDQIR